MNLHENDMEFPLDDFGVHHDDDLEDIRAPPQTRFNRMINLDMMAQTTHLRGGLQLEMQGSEDVEMVSPQKRLGSQAEVQPSYLN